MADLEPGHPAPKGPGLADKLREGIKALRPKVEEQVEGLKKPEKTQVFKSIFRVKHDDSERARALGVLTNVFFHL
ncbi:MAG TPA: hypothetical protein VFM21_02430, partial [Terriglobia bacterium]|nr:hypothetical protein [Terriglobia bacterium]